MTEVHESTYQPLTVPEIALQLRRRGLLLTRRRELEAQLERVRHAVAGQIEERAIEEQRLAASGTGKPADPAKALGANAETRERTLALLLEQEARYTDQRDGLLTVLAQLDAVNAEIEVAKVEREAVRLEHENKVGTLLAALVTPLLTIPAVAQ